MVELSAMTGQKKSFQAVMNVSMPSTAMPGRAIGSTMLQNDPQRRGAVDRAGLDQLVGQRLQQVLPHEEHPERGDQRRQR